MSARDGDDRDPDAEAPWEPTGPTLDPSGRLVGDVPRPRGSPGAGRRGVREARPQDASRGPGRSTPAPHADLDVDPKRLWHRDADGQQRANEEAPRPAVFDPHRSYETTLQRYEHRPGFFARLGRLLFRLLLLVVFLAAIAFGLHYGYRVLGWRLPFDVPGSRRAPATPTLRIESTPSGATVRVGEITLGTTPLFLDNHFPERAIEIELTLPGHSPWRGTFRGGQEARIVAQLERRR